MFNGGCYNSLQYNSTLVSVPDTTPQAAGGNFTRRKRRKVRQVEYKFSIDLLVVGKARTEVDVFYPVVGRVTKSLFLASPIFATKLSQYFSYVELKGASEKPIEQFFDISGKVSDVIYSDILTKASKSITEVSDFVVASRVKDHVMQQLPTVGLLKSSITRNISLKGLSQHRLDTNYAVDCKTDIRSLILLGLIDIE